MQQTAIGTRGTGGLADPAHIKGATIPVHGRA
jgi:hypothetical protein